MLDRDVQFLGKLEIFFKKSVKDHFLFADISAKVSDEPITYLRAVLRFLTSKGFLSVSRAENIGNRSIKKYSVEKFVDRATLEEAIIDIRFKIKLKNSLSKSKRLRSISKASPSEKRLNPSKTWNLDYLKNEILPQREKEIEEGKNAMTRQPIYVVLDLQEHCISGHEQDYSLHTNLKEMQPKFGYKYQDAEGEWIFSLEDQHCVTDEVTLFYTDRIVAFFFTRKGAEEYLEYQKHNLTENAYIYTFYSGYANQEMDKLLNGQ